MKDKICMVTGGNSGIGKETARTLAKKGATVIIVARSIEKGYAAQNEIIEETGNENVDLLIADLSLMSEVRQLAMEFKKRYSRLDVLVNNAGGINQNRSETTEGNELTLAVNHLAPFLLTHELLDSMKCSENPRIINVSSGAHRMGRINLDNFQNENYSSFRSYGTAKLMNIMFTYELARRLQRTNVTVNVLHPGFVNTGFGKSNASRFRILLMKLFSKFARSPEKGAETSIYLASSPEVVDITGRYFTNGKERNSSKSSYDEELQKKVWAKTEEILGIDSWTYMSMFEEIQC